MAGRRARAPNGIERTPPIRVPDTQTDRALSQIRLHLDRLDGARKRDLVTFDLVIGKNKVPHGLGRPAAGYIVTPTVLTAAFAHALDRNGNPRPDLEVWIDVVGADQPGAVVEVF